MILLVGASASGKTEVGKILLSKYGMKKAITHTSRSIRPNEVDGVDYHFVSKEEFLSLWNEGKLIENTFYNGNYYGCSKAEISEDKVVILDPNGLKKFQSLGDPTLITFLLTADEATRRKRMGIRGDEPGAIEKRIVNDRVAFSKEAIGDTDYVIATEGKSVEEIADLVYKTYQDRLKGGLR
ncbi:MAG: hypothetical protein J6328_03760 [Bacilli bacterium]|nr:hypothetical protein [Bacilli bacterium]